MTYRTLLFSTLLIVAPVLAGCSYTPARISSEPLVVLDGEGGHGGGHFCPPGQAKKGRC